MKSQTNKRVLRAAVSLVAVFSLAGCSTNSDYFPQIANPPPFDYVDGEELRSNMHKLAFELQQLDMALVDAYVDRPSFQRQIVDSIKNIERIGGYIQETDLAVRHPFLQDDMDRFLSDVSRARRDAERSVPRYYMAGRISGGCINCHGENR
jgi:outer membrane murein-binding lipoprotein Lpp